jgi:hypothetical protein
MNNPLISKIIVVHVCSLFYTCLCSSMEKNQLSNENHRRDLNFCAKLVKPHFYSIRSPFLLYICSSLYYISEKGSMI